MNIRKFYTFIFFILLSTQLLPQFNNFLNTSPSEEKEKINIVSMSLSSDNAIDVLVNIEDGYYAYLSSKIANKISFSPYKKEELSFKTINPNGIKKSDDLVVYAKQTFKLKSSKNIEAKNYSIIFDYQLCKDIDNICLAPEKKIINFEIGNNNLVNILSIENIPSTSNVIVDDNSLVSKINNNNNNIILTLILIFLAGITSTLLPCTYPLLSITISLIGVGDKDGNRNKKQSVISSALFSLGVITTYTLLGAIVSILGFVFHKNILFGSIGYNPILLTIIIVLFLYFTFSMAGFYDIRLPAFLNNLKNDTYTKNKNSIFYKYVVGLVTGIVATPCAAPIIALILEISFLNPTFGVLYMFVYASGFSLVLFVLSISISAILNKIPKAGNWMGYVRFIFSFVMLVVCYYYIEILLKTIGIEKFSPMLAGLIIFATSFLVFFILNKKEKIILSVKEIKIFFTILILGVIIATTYTTIKQVSIESDSMSLKDAITLSQKTNQKIFIDFYAVWCENCYLLEKNVLKSEAMKEYMKKNNYIFIKVDVDKNKDIANEFSIKWLPWIVVIDSNKNVLYQKNSFDSFDDKIIKKIIDDLSAIE